MPSKKKLCERSDATLSDIINNRGRMVSPSDLASAGILGSYSTIKVWIDRGWLPKPHRLPNGQQYWTGGEIADALGHQPSEDDKSGTCDPQVAEDAEAEEANAAKKAANADEEADAEEVAA